MPLTNFATQLNSEELYHDSQAHSVYSKSYALSPYHLPNLAESLVNFLAIVSVPPGRTAERCYSALWGAELNEGYAGMTEVCMSFLCC